MANPGSHASQSLPEGSYLSLNRLLRVGVGGQTRAVIGRNRLFTTKSGQATTLLTIDNYPEYPAVRSYYEKTGELVEGMHLLNIHEWFRNRAPDSTVTGVGEWANFTVQADDVRSWSLDEYRVQDVEHPDGGVRYRAYVQRILDREVARDYFRPDGSTYLRAPAAARSSITPYVLFDHDGKALGGWSQLYGWHWAWLRALVGDAERVFLLCDSRAALYSILPVRDARFHLVHQVHNAHMRGESAWNSWVVPDYERMFASIPQLDALVLLSERQREDIAERYGATNNIFAIPNTVDQPTLPEPMPARDPATFAIVSRLEPQKNLGDAIDAWARVVQQRPQARLLIYGRGVLQERLQRRIDELGLGSAVSLMGYDREARKTLLTATGFLMTSTYEGYPLATLESLSIGCPVISYDILYGPRDQITDGVDGFLVRPGDVAGLADRVVRLIDDPALVSRLSEGAIRAARRHDHDAYVRQWASLLSRVAAQKPTRVRLRISHQVHELVNLETPVKRPGNRAVRLANRFIERLAPMSAPATAHTSSWSGPRAPRIRFSATLTVRGEIPPGVLRRARLTLVAISPAGAVRRLPLAVMRTGRRFELSSEFGTAKLLNRLPPEDRSIRLRLRMVINNAAWEVEPARPNGSRTGYEVSFRDDGTIAVHGDPRS